MGILDDSDAVFRYHRNMAMLHGTDSSLALGWLSHQDQQVRFEALSGIADLNNKTIFDVGCGYADLFAFLSRRYKLSHYYGIEQIPELLEEAVKRYEAIENVTLIPSDFMRAKLPIADYVFASGSLNYANSDAGYIFKAITTLFETCHLGLAFNLLHTIPENGLLVAYEPEIILDHCRSLSPKVLYNDGYAPDDYTVWMYR